MAKNTSTFFQETLFSCVKSRSLSDQKEVQSLVRHDNTEDSKVPTDAAPLLNDNNGSSKLFIYIMGTFLNAWYSFLKINDMDIL